MARTSGALGLAAILACAADCGSRTGLSITVDAGGPPDATASDPGPDAEADASEASAPCSNDHAPLPPSCVPGGAGMTNCGQGTESCCTSLPVPAGTYARTYTNAGDGGTGASDPASVSCFLLDQYEVTVGRYRQFVNAVSPPGYGPGWTPALGSGKHSHLNGGRGLVDVAPHAGTGVTYETGWSEADAESFPGFTGGGLGLAGCGPYSTGTASPGADENLPIDCVDWIDAYAFCIWDGGFLPSEAEWEYAAAGGSQQREYPWGEADPGRSNRYAIYECNYGGPCTGSPDSIAPVGWATLGAARWGQLDLAGNVWEWTLDDYAAYVDPCVDCAYLPQSAGYPVIRGGRFDDLPPVLEPSYRTYPTSNGPGIGFRCARAP